MIRSISASVLLAALVCTLAGCGTMANLKPAKSSDEDAPKPQRVFGGVEHDVAWSKKCFGPPDEKDGKEPGLGDQLKGTCYMFVDLPLSFVGDVVTLPFTLLVALGEEEDSLKLSTDTRGDSMR
jgi:uncharacterized protein YceK